MHPESLTVEVLPTPEAVAEALARRTETLLRSALAKSAIASLCLTGGSTPKPAYQRLRSADLDWSRVHVFWTDERLVPPDDEASNVSMARNALLNAIPEAHIHAPQGDLSPEQAADAYETGLQQVFGEPPPSFDVLHLGMGEDGHTASLFPGGPELEVTDRWVTSSVAPSGSSERQRVSLTLPALNAARHVLVAAHGEAKRPAFLRVMDAYDANASGSSRPPISNVSPDGPVIWLVDRMLAQGALKE